jgi:hypothetical protein
MSEQRLEARFLCADLVRVDWIAGEGGAGGASGGSSAAGRGQLRTLDAVLEDISPLGACVQVEERIPLGTAVSITTGYADVDSARRTAEDATRFSGYVSYCEYRDFGYFVGIRLSDDTRWSTGLFEPRHLTNLATLAQTRNRKPRAKAPRPS